MTTPVTVAVYIDRGEAIRAARNKWGWQKTEIDLDVLASPLREALSQCPEEDGAILITHSETRPGVEKTFLASMLDDIEGLKDSFEVERDGMAPLVEATPETALQMLDHLGSLPGRLRAMGTELLSSAEALATARQKEAMDQVEAHLADVDRWLGAAPDRLFTVHWDGGSSLRFERTEVPKPPALATDADEKIAFDLEEARRLLNGQRPRVNKGRRGGRTDDPFDFSPPPPPEHIATAEEALALGVQERKEAVKEHRRAIAAAEGEHQRAFDAAYQAKVQKEREAAAIAHQQALEARKDPAKNQILREWAATCEKSDVLKLLDEGGGAEEITESLRSILFEPLTSFESFKKITKQDLLIANPNLADMASGLKAEFDDAEVDFPDPKHHAAAQALVQAAWRSGMPAQFSRRLHRGKLTRRGEVVGISVEARSILVTACFGELKVSRAFAIGILGPAE